MSDADDAAQPAPDVLNADLALEVMRAMKPDELNADNLSMEINLTEIDRAGRAQAWQTLPRPQLLILSNFRQKFLAETGFRLPDADSNPDFPADLFVRRGATPHSYILSLSKTTVQEMIDVYNSQQKAQ